MLQAIHTNKTMQDTRLRLSVFVVWLFHVSAMVGITLGYKDWFVAKTPLNLLLAFGLLVLNFPFANMRVVATAALFYGMGMGVEWVGVHHDWLFGPYYYGANLGPKLDGVPWLIGINWVVLALISGTLANRYLSGLLPKIVAGALLMVGLDFFIEVTAPPFDFWVWENGAAPLRNYVSWLGVALVMQSIFQLRALHGNFSFCLQLYLAQLAFFVYFYVYHSL